MSTDAAPAPSTVLLVEDDPAIAETVVYALRAEGFAVEHRMLGRGVAERVRAGAGSTGTGLARRCRRRRAERRPGRRSRQPRPGTCAASHSVPPPSTVPITVAASTSLGQCSPSTTRDSATIAVNGTSNQASCG